MRLVAGFLMNQDLSRAVPHLWGLFEGLSLISTAKIKRQHGIKWDSKTLLEIDCADAFSTKDKNFSKMNGFLKVLKGLGARISLKINAKKTKSLRLKRGESEEVILGNKKIDQVDSFAYLVRLVKMLEVE